MAERKSVTIEIKDPKATLDDLQIVLEIMPPCLEAEVVVRLMDKIKEQM